MKEVVEGIDELLGPSQPAPSRDFRQIPVRS